MRFRNHRFLAGLLLLLIFRCEMRQCDSSYPNSPASTSISRTQRYSGRFASRTRALRQLTFDVTGILIQSAIHAGLVGCGGPATKAAEPLSAIEAIDCQNFGGPGIRFMPPLKGLRIKMPCHPALK